MITITQYFHFPNNTELGKGNTHECYLLIPNSYDLSHIFPSGEEVEVTDVASERKYYLKSAYGREFRINQMGQFYRDYDVHMGDEIILTHVAGVNSRTLIEVNRHQRVVIKYGRNGGEIINIERLSPFKKGDSYVIPIVWNDQELSMTIQYKGALAKRNDSPELTDYYTIKLGYDTLQNGSYLLTLGNPNELSTYEKTDLKVFPFDETIIGKPSEAKKTSTPAHLPNESIVSTYLPYLTALRSKPFMLLAGISGTGKSRLVKELAFMTCLEDAVDAETKEPYEAQTDETTPFNYCLIEVKPNWHDSSELLGYYNALDGKYELTPFIRFVYTAIRYTNMPFFVCLDEMNLAPVEQYFAEYLSALETRTLTDNGIVSAPLLDSSLFNKIDESKYNVTDLAIVKYLAKNGLKLPNNLYIIGTVNMDDTTHQFSRKVIDRAFTIEMNGGDLNEMFSDKNSNALKYRKNAEVLPLEAISSLFVQASDMFKAGSPYLKYEQTIKESVPSYLNAINNKLANTPFQVSYRVQNELILYLACLIQQNNFPDDIEALIKEAVLAVLMEKILPRVQGDDKLLGRGKDKDVFTELTEYVEQNLILKEQTEDNTEVVSGSDLYRQVINKLDQMHKRLENSYFANFF